MTQEREPSQRYQDAQREAGQAANGDDVRSEGFAVAHSAEPNRVLANLSVEDYTQVLPQLTPIALRFKHIVYKPNQPIAHVYFVRDGVASVIATDDGKDAIEVGIIGREGFLGLPVLFGSDSLPYRVIMQVEGDAWRTAASTFRSLLQQLPALQRECLSYAHYFNIQVSQSVACNRVHSLEERCARWLLMTVERLHGDAFETTHEFLSIMLGVRRAGVTVAMGTLQSAGIIRYSRGRVSILDRPALERASCPCYGVTRDAAKKVGVGLRL
jgi:CRP-like cAMP-binding protein